MIHTKIRSEEQVQAEYKKTWATKMRRIKRFFGPDSADALDVLNLISADANQRYGLLNDKAVGETTRLAFDAYRLPYDGIETLHRIAGCGEFYFPQSRRSVAAVAKRMIESGEVDTVVELGSGSGDNLFRCFHNIDWPFRDKVEFFGLEFTAQGREAADLLASKQPEMQFQSRAFNYYQPDFEFLKDRPRKILFFTNHSIEQITVLPKVFFDALLTLPGARIAHSEPVGWQANELLVEARSNNDEAFSRRSGRISD